MSTCITFTVIIPLFNKGPYIARAIESVLNQSKGDFELLIIDDGSTDDGPEVVKEFDDDRIRMIRQENRGETAARNKGVSEAAYEFLAFLDADDEWMPDYLKNMQELILTYPDIGWYGAAYVIDYGNMRTIKSYGTDKKCMLINSYFQAHVDFGAELVNMSCFTINKRIVEEIGGFPVGIKCTGDIYFLGRVALEHPLGYCPIPSAIIHKNEDNVSDKVIDFLRNPFIDYVQGLPKDMVQRRPDYKYLFEYIQWLKLMNCYTNVLNGYNEMVKRDLLEIDTESYGRVKLFVKFLSSFEPKVSRSIASIVPMVLLIKYNVLFSGCDSL